jgi:hypothetical protein
LFLVNPFSLYKKDIKISFNNSSVSLLTNNISCDKQVIGNKKNRNVLSFLSSTLDVRWFENDFISKDNLPHINQFCSVELGTTSNYKMVPESHPRLA